MMMSKEYQTYMNIDEQQAIRNKLVLAAKQTPLKEKFFFDYGTTISSVLVCAANLVYFRSAFLAYNMYKYNRGRLITPFMSTIFSFQGSLCHVMIVKDELLCPFRSENMWHYGWTSLIGHQIASAISLMFVSGTCFLNAQLNGMIPVRTHFFRNSGKKIEGLKYGITKLIPHMRPIAATWLITSATMFTIGVLEYKQHCNLLAKLNRKTMTHRED